MPGRERGGGLPCGFEEHHAGDVVVGAGEEREVPGVQTEPPAGTVLGLREDDIPAVVAAGLVQRDGGQQRQRTSDGGHPLAPQPAVDAGRDAAEDAHAGGEQPAQALEAQVDPHADEAPGAQLDVGALDHDLDRARGARHGEVRCLDPVSELLHHELVADRDPELGVGQHHRHLPGGLGDEQRVLTAVGQRSEEAVCGGPVHRDEEAPLGEAQPVDGEPVLGIRAVAELGVARPSGIKTGASVRYAGRAVGLSWWTRSA